MVYNPFEKPVGEVLQPEDLQLLITWQVAEGYYVEYKREMPNTTKIARSLASLANTYGGWYIVGVETDSHNVATAVSGFDPTSCHDPISVVRDLVKHHIDPVPIFFPQVITLETGHLVLTVYVPDRQETPFITKDGRIYRRTHDSSDPVSETSRYALDQIVERGKEVSKRFARFSKDKNTFSKAEKDGWLKIYISPYPFGLIKHPEVFFTPVIETLLEASKKPIEIPLLDTPEFSLSGNIEFNVAYVTPVSTVLRQTNIQNEAFNSLAIELDIFGRTKIFIPLQGVQLENYDLSSIRSRLVNQQIFNRIKAQPNGGSTYLHFFDIGKVWLIVAILVSYYLDWLGESTALIGFQVALELDKVWRYVPFYNFDLWGQHVEQFGLPVLMRDYVRFPEEEGKGMIISNSSKNNLWIALCWKVGLACGLPSECFASALDLIIKDASERGKPLG